MPAILREREKIFLMVNINYPELKRVHAILAWTLFFFDNMVCPSHPLLAWPYAEIFFLLKKKYPKFFLFSVTNGFWCVFIVEAFLKGLCIYIMYYTVAAYTFKLNNSHFRSKNTEKDFVKCNKCYF
jgi:hypothetical protein